MQSLLIWTALALGLIYIFIEFYKHFTYWQRQGVQSLKFINIGWNRAPAFQFYYDQSLKFGRVYGDYGIAHKILLLNDAKLARDLSIKELHKFPIRNSSFKYGSTNLTKSLFFMDANDDWKRIRSIVTPAFTSGKLKRMLTPIERLTQNFIEHMRPMAKSGEEFDLKRYIGGFSMDVIACCAYGIELDSIKEPNHPVVVNAKKILNVDVTLSAIVAFIFPTLGKWLNLNIFNKDAINYFDDLTFQIVEKRMKNGDVKQNPDLLGLMIENSVSQENENQNGSTNSNLKLKGISKDELAGQGIIFFIAGFDTTHATFDHVTYYLAKYPEWQEKLYQELNEVRDELDYDKFKTLPILNAIINETLRLNPPLVLFQRESKEDCELLDTGIKIPKNTVIQINPYVIHRDPGYFPDPHSFKPERFLDKSSNLESHFAYMPFGVGGRLCVGMRFAQNELRIGLANMVLNYKVTVDPAFELEYFNGSPLMSPKRLMVRISERY